MTHTDLPSQGDQTPITEPDIDWSGWFDPERLDHVRSLLSHALAEGTCTRSVVAGLMVAFGRKDTLSVSRRSRSHAPVDMTSALVAQANVSAQRAATAQAVSDYEEAVRSVYRDGATAGALARSLGLSLSRVNQLVSGARAGLT
jgi:hypothetical protein